MLNVMLINPPQRYYNKSQGFSSYFPIGLLSIAAKIETICKVKIYDCFIEDFEINKSEDYCVYGTPIEKIEAAIRAFKPDIVGISVPFSTQSASAINLCKMCRDIDPNITLVLGGPDPSVRFEVFLLNGVCDYCVIGEGEITFYEFILNLEQSDLKNITGLAYILDENIHFKPRKFLSDLDSLPPPAYHLIDVNKYLRSKYHYTGRSHLHKNSISMFTSRGCPFNCIFCSIKSHMGKKFRYHSTDYVLKHIKHCVENFGISNFHFEDDNMSFDKKRFEAILDGIIESELKISWDVPNGIRLDTLNYTLLEKIKKSGCKKLAVAIESGNQSVLDNIIKKSLSLPKVNDIVKDCKKLGIILSAFYVIGFPGEKKEEIQQTIDLAIHFLREYDVIPNLLIATPLYGTELYDICVAKGYIGENISDEDLGTGTQSFGNPVIATEDFSLEDIKHFINDYFARYKRAMMFYSFRHPIYSFQKIKNKIPILIQILTYK